MAYKDIENRIKAGQDRIDSILAQTQSVQEAVKDKEDIVTEVTRLQVTLEYETEKLKRMNAQKKAEERKKTTRTKIQEGGYVDSIIGKPTDFSEEAVTERLRYIGRLINLGLVVDAVLQAPADPKILRYFLRNQEQTGRYFSKFMLSRTGDTVRTDGQ